MDTKSFISHTMNENVSVFSFNTSRSYEMPVSLLTSDIEQFQVALTFAAKLIDHEKTLYNDYIKETVFAEYVKTLEMRSNSEVTNKLSILIKSISDKEAQFNEKLQDIHSTYENQIRLLVKDKVKLQDDATAMKSEIENRFDKELKTLRRQLAEKESEILTLSKSESIIRDQCSAESERLIKLIEEKHSKSFTTIKESYEQIIALKEDTLQQRELKIIKREDELTNILQRNASSSFRGQDGETYFKDLVESTVKWKLTDTSKIPHSCDYSSVIHKSNIFFEVKNYTNEIKSEEVTKFLRDMKEHPEINMGIFISLNTRICGKDPSIPILIEWIHDSQCVIYIQTFKELDLNHTLHLLDQLIKISATYNKLIISNNSSEESFLQQRIDKARIYIEEYISESVLLIKRVINDQKLHRQHVESSYSHTLSILRLQSTAIHTALEILTGEYREEHAEPIEDTVEVQKKPKRKTSISKKSNSQS